MNKVFKVIKVIAEKTAKPPPSRLKMASLRFPMTTAQLGLHLETFRVQTA